MRSMLMTLYSALHSVQMGPLTASVTDQQWLDPSQLCCKPDRSVAVIGRSARQRLEQQINGVTDSLSDCVHALKSKLKTFVFIHFHFCCMTLFAPAVCHSVANIWHVK